MSRSSLTLLQQTIWDARLPLEIRLAAAESRVYDQADAYMVGVAPGRFSFDQTNNSRSHGLAYHIYLCFFLACMPSLPLT
jgi:hypothetical protein